MGDAVQEALMKGVGAHKAGQLDQAKELYASVIQVEPRHPDANHNWGLVSLPSIEFKIS